MIDLTRYNNSAKMLALKKTGQVGPRTFSHLLAHYKTIDNILLAEEAELLELDGVGQKRSQAIACASERLEGAAAEIENLITDDASAVSCLDDNYPQLLSELNDPPMLIYFKGKIPSQDEKRVAIIGSQDVSAEGIGDAVELARRLSEQGAAIVGGLARGIDTAGHIGALRSDGITYAVLPCGFNKIHPVENEPMTKEILARGGLLSEYPPDTTVNAGRLMSRNRITVGLSHAVVIGETSIDSVGTLDAAKCCYELGKLLFTIIGRNNPHYEQLAAYGAIPLTTIDDHEMVLKALV